MASKRTPQHPAEESASDIDLIGKYLRVVDRCLKSSQVKNPDKNMKTQAEGSKEDF